MTTPEPYPKYVELPTVVVGDTWPGFRIGPFSDVSDPENPIDPSDSLGNVDTAIWRLARITDPVVTTIYTASSSAGADGDISINDAGTWDITIPAQILRTGTPGNYVNVSAGGYYWSLTLELDLNNGVYTFFNGYLRIIPALPATT